MELIGLNTGWFLAIWICQKKEKDAKMNSIYITLWKKCDVGVNEKPLALNNTKKNKTMTTNHNLDKALKDLV